jgi:hypothetical protein
VAHCYDELQFERVLLVGWSGGGSLSSMYQSIASSTSPPPHWTFYMWLHVGDVIDYLFHVGNNAPFGYEEEERKMILVNKIIHISLVFLRSRLVRKCVRALLWNKAFKRKQSCVCSSVSYGGGVSGGDRPRSCAGCIAMGEFRLFPPTVCGFDGPPPVEVVHNIWIRLGVS